MDMAFDLQGHVALITGGNGGIGLGMARALAAAGADVAIWGRSEEKNRAAASELESLGVRAIALVCDVSDEQDVERSFARTVEVLGKVDSCFANAGVAAQAGPFTEQTRDDWRRVLGVNLEGAFLTLRAATRHMVARGEGGSLVGVSSMGSVQGMPQAQVYAASKAGLTATMNGLAVELARHRVRANTILPGFVLTDMTPAFRTERYEQRVLPRIPQRRWGEPRDFGGIAVYLASGASAYHTGGTFLIDGGYSRY